MSAPQPLRGQVFRVDISNVGPKPYAVVSNNQRNRLLDSVLAVRITTTDKSRVPTAVPLTREDPLVGYALADDIVELFKDELEEAQYMGALAPGTVVNLNDALMQALGIGT
jgi:mRNA interferase MazF